MTQFQVLWIKEHVDEEVHKLDSRVCILYDSSDESFYYYGTRNNEGQKLYANFKGSYSYNQFNSFITFLNFLMNRFDEVLTIELHSVDIPHYEYNLLTYNSFMNKFNKGSLLSAYDKRKETSDSVSNYLDMLVNK